MMLTPFTLICSRPVNTEIRQCNLIAKHTTQSILSVRSLKEEGKKEQNEDENKT